MARPQVGPSQVLLRVRACGVCRTDLHIVEGELPPLRTPLIPGHQIVGEIVEGATPELPLGTRVGVSSVGGVDGTCPYCVRNAGNLCDSPTFTGYTVNGGYAEYVLARADCVYPYQTVSTIGRQLLCCVPVTSASAACEAGAEPGDHVGLFGFGSSASLAIAVVCSWNCKVYV